MDPDGEDAAPHDTTPHETAAHDTTPHDSHRRDDTDLAALVALLAVEPAVVVAFSGGVDSSVVAAGAARALGERALAVTASSPALATGELAGAREVAAVIGI
jgi:PP-loop superfamily ATP-utilizing enzyme